MNIINDLSNAIVLCDFDGTITTFDTNVRLFDKYGEENYINKIRRKYYNEEIDLKTLCKLEFKSISMMEKDYLNYILTEVQLQNGFRTFYNNLQKYNIPFAIVSGGFINGIKPFMKKHGFENIPIYANKLIFNDGNIEVEFYDEKHLIYAIHKEDYIDCKVEILNRYREKYRKIIFIGDGSTDKNVAKEADILFAKDYLEEYCIENEIDYIGWKDFYDINEYFFENREKAL